MYNNVTYYTVTESNVLANDTVGVQDYVFTDKPQAEAKLYKLWGYAANPPEEETRQLFSAYLTEHRHNSIILLESKVFDYRQPEPAPEPEPEPEPENDAQEG